MEIKFLLKNKEFVLSPFEIPYEDVKESLNYFIYLKCLEFDKDFIEDIKRIRKIFGIPPQGFESRILLDVPYTFKGIPPYLTIIQKVNNQIIGKNKFFGYVEDLNTKYSVPLGFTSTNILKSYPIAEVILFNAISVNRITYLISVTSSASKPYRPYVEIDLHVYLEKTELLRLIDKSYDELIKPHLVRLPKAGKTFIDKDTYEILHLHAHDNLKFPEIAERLQLKSVKNVYSETVKMNYYRANQRIQKFRNQLKAERDFSKTEDAMSIWA